jgi:hypothetical protein
MIFPAILVVLCVKFGSIVALFLHVPVPRSMWLGTFDPWVISVEMACEEIYDAIFLFVTGAATDVS